MVCHDTIKGQGTDRPRCHPTRPAPQTQAVQLSRIPGYGDLHRSQSGFLPNFNPILPDSRVIYRRYASLYFVCGITVGENELDTLEIVHRYVENLDQHFGSVCHSFVLSDATS